jgi:hypothetical protein
MDHRKIALICDYDYERSSGIIPARFLSQVDALRRTLEKEFPIKQIGLGIFMLDAGHKEGVFALMDRLEGNDGEFIPRFSFTCDMVLKLVQLVPMEQEIKAWREQTLLNEHETQMRECSPEDFYCATLEKG